MAGGVAAKSVGTGIAARNMALVLLGVRRLVVRIHGAVRILPQISHIAYSVHSSHRLIQRPFCRDTAAQSNHSRES